jgi:hypothetical protein
MQRIIIALLSIFVLGCNDLRQYREQTQCSYDNYKSFKNDDAQARKLYECIEHFRESNFRGVIVVREDSLSYGWHEGFLMNSDFILKVLNNYKVYAVSHVNEVSYFKKNAGFIDDSCGLMYIPNGAKMPVGVKESRLLVDNPEKGKWYYVEAKL